MTCKTHGIYGGKIVREPQKVIDDDGTVYMELIVERPSLNFNTATFEQKYQKIRCKKFFPGAGQTMVYQTGSYINCVDVQYKGDDYILCEKLKLLSRPRPSGKILSLYRLICPRPHSRQTKLFIPV